MEECVLPILSCGLDYVLYASLIVASLANAMDSQITENIVKLGGVKVMDKMGHKDRGWFANFKDPEGNRFGTYEPNGAAMGKQE